jgi:hypothetical protein
VTVVMVELALSSTNRSRVGVVAHCLAHRGGLVGVEDIDATGGLCVSWLHHSFYVLDEDGQHPLTIPYVVAKESQLVVQEETREKRFPRGTRVVFDSVEFAEIAWAVSLVATKVALAVDERGRRAGITFQGGQADSDVPPA